MVEPRMRRLILPAIGCLPAIAVKQRVKPRHDLALRRIALQFHGNGRERSVEIIDARKSLLRHPDNAIATVIRHQVARPDGEDELGRQRSADNDELALLAVENCGKSSAQCELVRLRKTLVDDDFLGSPGLRQASGPDVEAVE